MPLPAKPRYIARNAKMLYRKYGVRSPFIVVARILEFAHCVLFREKTFQFRGQTYRYFFHLENPTFRVPRCVEIPIILTELEGYTADNVLEIGNVLQNYGTYHHMVVDKYEKDQNVINQDILDFNPGKLFDLIVIISTLEHIGWDETPRDSAKIPKALAQIKSLLNPGGRLVATMPLGYNTYLDSLVAGNKLGFDELFFLRRISRNNIWKEACYNEVRNLKYGEPYICANALIVAYFTKPQFEVLDCPCK